MTEQVPGPDHPVSLESPASIAIIGAGPLGLEAALYGRFLGYAVTVLERGEVAHNVADWEHVTMFTPFSMLHSTLARRAIEIQDQQHPFPGWEDLVTGRQWREDYLLPLSRTDLLRKCIHIGCEVTSVARSRYRKHREIGSEKRLQSAFTVNWIDPEGKENSDEFDFVIDASGSYGNVCGLGPGGVPALGETAIRQQWETDYELKDRLHFSVPDFEKRPSLWSQQRILVLGDGFSAATTIQGLYPLKPQQVFWLTDQTVGEEGPLKPLDADPLPARAELSAQVNRLGRKSRKAVPEPETAGFQFVANAQVTGIQWDDEAKSFQVTIRTWEDIDWESVEDGFEEPDDTEVTISVDQIVANTGYYPNVEIFRQLQVHLCYATEGPMALASSLVNSGSDCMKAPQGDCHSVLTTEGRFFVVGIKSYGRLSNFLYLAGLQQVRDIYRWIVGRKDLDLYQRPL